jgi:hypothetical protein
MSIRKTMLDIPLVACLIALCVLLIFVSLVLDRQQQVYAQFEPAHTRTNIYDNHGRYKGYINGEGTIYDDHGRYTGKIVEENPVSDYKGYGETKGDSDYDPLTN